MRLYDLRTRMNNINCEDNLRENERMATRPEHKAVFESYKKNRSPYRVFLSRILLGPLTWLCKQGEQKLLYGHVSEEDLKDPLLKRIAGFGPAKIMRLEAFGLRKAFLRLMQDIQTSPARVELEEKGMSQTGDLMRLRDEFEEELKKGRPTLEQIMEITRKKRKEQKGQLKEFEKSLSERLEKMRKKESFR